MPRVTHLAGERRAHARMKLARLERVVHAGYIAGRSGTAPALFVSPTMWERHARGAMGGGGGRAGRNVSWPLVTDRGWEVSCCERLSWGCGGLFGGLLVGWVFGCLGCGWLQGMVDGVGCWCRLALMLVV